MVQGSEILFYVIHNHALVPETKVPKPLLPEKYFSWPFKRFPLADISNRYIKIALSQTWLLDALVIGGDGFAYT